MNNAARIAADLLKTRGTAEAARRAALTKATAGALSPLTDKEREQLMRAAQTLHVWARA